MTRKELQDALRPYKTEFPHIKLNAKTDKLQAWWNEINGQQILDLDSIGDETAVSLESNQTEELTGQTCELTCVVRLPLVLDAPKCDINPVPNKADYWEQWQVAYDKAIKAIQISEREIQQPAKSTSFGAVVITTANIVLDGVRCFADMVKQVYKSVTKKRKKPVGFGV